MKLTIVLLVAIPAFIMAHTDDVYLAVRRVQEPEAIQGKPGKRGAVGPAGPVGPRGQPGSNGQCSCNITELRRPLEEQIRQLTERLESSVETLQGNIDSLRIMVRRIHKVADVGWYTPGNDYQYMISPSSQSWQDSRTFCQTRGGDLAVFGIRNTTTRNTIRLQLLRRTRVFIGLNDILREGAWVWINGESLDSGIPPWQSGQPNSYGGGEDCGDLNFLNRDGINDCSCSSNLPALCEKSL